MTLGLAVLCENRKTAIVVSDREERVGGLNVHGIGVELPCPKFTRLNDSCVMMTSYVASAGALPLEALRQRRESVEEETTVEGVARIAYECREAISRSIRDYKIGQPKKGL